MSGTTGDGLVTLRLATERDLEEIFAIYDREVLHGVATFDTQPRSAAQRLEWLAQHLPERYPVMVAECGGVVAGWGSISRWSDRSAYARTAEDSVYIGEPWRGRGIGRMILADLLVRAEAAGIRVVVARIVEGNPASIRLHEALGFGRIGVMRGVGEKFGRVLDVVLMDRRLGE